MTYVTFALVLSALISGLGFPEAVRQILFGAIIVAVVLLMPRGVLGLLQIRYRLPRTI